MKSSFAFILFLHLSSFSFSQNKDTAVLINNRYVTLSNVVVNNKLNVSTFIKRVQSDTSFYKAFKNLRILGYTAINDVRMLKSENKYSATLHSKTKQYRVENCRKMKILEEEFSEIGRAHV